MQDAAPAGLWSRSDCIERMTPTCGKDSLTVVLQSRETSNISSIDARGRFALQELFDENALNAGKLVAA